MHTDPATLQAHLREALSAAAASHRPDVEGRLAEFDERAGAAPASHHVRALAAPAVAAVAIFAVVLGVVFGVGRIGGRDDSASSGSAASPFDPWSPPVVRGGNGSASVQQLKHGQRLELLRTDRGTVAVSAAVVGGKLCWQVAEATPPGTRPRLTGSSCESWPPSNDAWTESGMKPVTATGNAAYGGWLLALTSPQAVSVTWRTNTGVSSPKVHRLGGFPAGVVVLSVPVGNASSFTARVSDAAGRPLGSKPFTLFPDWNDGPPEMPSAVGGTPLFDYGKGNRRGTMYAVVEGGRVQFRGGPEIRTVDQFGSGPVTPKAPVEEIGLDRVFLGERWVAGTMRPDVRRVVYRLADGTELPAQAKQIKGSQGRIWFVRLPGDRLNKPPARGDVILAYAETGLVGQAIPRY
jgi:hypothetical protein